MVHARKMELRFWAKVVNAAVFVLNRTGPSSIPNKSPFKLWYGKNPEVNHLRVSGEDVYTIIPKEHRQKLDVKSLKCGLVG